MSGLRSPRLQSVRLASLAAGVLVGLPVVLGGSPDSGVFWSWVATWITFCAATWVAFREEASLGERYALMAAQGLAVVGMVLLLCDGFEGALLVVVATQLGLFAPRRLALPWILIQTVLLAAAIWIHWSMKPALTLSPPYLGAQILAFLVLESLRREAHSREELARANATLRMTRELLAESARLSERLRLARELHDEIGHHLVALRLNLEALAHPSAAEVPRALETARGLLTRVHDCVESMANDRAAERGIDLRRALSALSDSVPKPRLHVELDGLQLDDADRAHALLRCCQEITTNAMKHSGAESLWISMRNENGAILLDARDDGRGAESIRAGRGLAGMRERLAAYRGELEVRTKPGRGFALAIRLPLEGTGT